MSLLANFTVISGKASEDLARKIATKLEAKYIKSELRIFPDGESKITLKNKPRGRIIVVHSIYPPVDSNLIRALALVSQAKRYSSQVYVVVPYLGYARQDREFLPGEAITMSLVAKMFKAAGATRIFVVDIHSMMALKHFQIPAKNVTAIQELVKYFKKLNLKDPVVVSPDMGGAQRARNFASLLGVEFIALEKHRDRKSGEVRIKSGNHHEIRGRDIILVDDIISTGNSIVKAAQFLKKQRCGRIYASCTHALLIGDAEERIKKAGVARIISTNTIPGKTGIVDVSPVIAKAIV
ncbi:MAG: phosphoribosylpyrophosphate synthetase [Thaumarchaeota archaeon 13_1_20CM_2_39_20]|nr:MAG: phosphoribosylpyrophosphate synthetase [Thaumarchaeota archaeon 13_1_40CM_2_39_13_1]OLE40516.1 MAG: phosphoribosylpyrophosphate synthetase [Thaumarchaeota archaeon 13_1_20CM_2_39_20]